MSEKFPHRNISSAEQNFLIDSQDEYMRFSKFCSDPKQFIIDVLDASDKETMPEKLSQVVDEIEKMIDIFYSESRPSTGGDNQKIEFISKVAQLNDTIALFLQHERDSYEAFKSVVQLLKLAGVAKEDVLTYVNVKFVDIGNDAELQRRSCQAIIKQVYDE